MSSAWWITANDMMAVHVKYLDLFCCLGGPEMDLYKTKIHCNLKFYREKHCPQNFLFSPSGTIMKVNNSNKK